MVCVYPLLLLLLLLLAHFHPLLLGLCIHVCVCVNHISTLDVFVVYVWCGCVCTLGVVANNYIRGVGNNLDRLSVSLCVCVRLSVSLPPSVIVCVYEIPESFLIYF